MTWQMQKEEEEEDIKQQIDTIEWKSRTGLTWKTTFPRKSIFNFQGYEKFSFPMQQNGEFNIKGLKGMKEASCYAGWSNC